jgi:hypothetical protein
VFVLLYYLQVRAESVREGQFACSHLQNKLPSLMLLGKAWSLPQSGATERWFTRVGSAVKSLITLATGRVDVCVVDRRRRNDLSTLRRRRNDARQRRSSNDAQNVSPLDAPTRRKCVNLINLFYSSLIVGQNKLECFSGKIS